jgi:hypothetical protein
VPLKRSSSDCKTKSKGYFSERTRSPSSQFYHDFANVDLKGTAFHPQLTFTKALKSFRNAVLQYVMQHRLMYKNRCMTNLVDTAPEEARERYPRLIT